MSCPHLLFMDLWRTGARSDALLLPCCFIMNSNDLLLLLLLLFLFYGPVAVPVGARAGICLVRWESDFNTSAIGSLNADGSLDHGLFQISDLYWCDHGDGMDGACGLSCDGSPSSFSDSFPIPVSRRFRLCHNRILLFLFFSLYSNTQLWGTRISKMTLSAPSESSASTSTYTATVSTPGNYSRLKTTKKANNINSCLFFEAIRKEIT